MLVGLAVGLISLAFGFEALANGGKRNGMPAFPFFMFGVAGCWRAQTTFRMIRSGALGGAPRLAWHLWRVRVRRNLPGIVVVSAPEAA